MGDGGTFTNSCPGASCALEACSIRHFSPCVPSLHPQHRAVPSHHGLQTNSSTAPKLFFYLARLVAAALNPNQNLHSSRCSPVATERHQEPAALHCGTPGPFLHRSAGSSPLSPNQRSHANSFAVPLCLPLKQIRGEWISQVSAWHTWTRTASCPDPPAETSRRNELFYWRRGGWQPGCASDWSMRGG